MKKDHSDFRLYLLFSFFILLGAVILGRLFYLQVKDYKKYKTLAESQHIKEKKIYAKRGKVFFSDEATLLAENQGVANVAVAPREIKNREELISKLSLALNIPESSLSSKIKSTDPWIIIKNKVPLSKTEKIENIPGVHLEPYFNRFYPQGEIASSLIGFYGFDQTGKKKVGQYGIEGYYEKQLAGEDGFRRGVVDANQDPIFSVQNQIKDPLDGSDLVLTIDSNIQFFLENKTKEIFEKYKPDNATIIVMSPKTGEILGMASSPNFDPNNYQKEKDVSVFKNPAVLPFEPGSIFKPLTASMALEEKVVTPNTTYVDKGVVKLGGFAIKNSDLKAHGTKTMTQVIELSLNTGAVFMQQRVGRLGFIRYVKKFGFGKKTNIDLYGEEAGDIENILHPRSSAKLIECANASFGQGVTASPVQILMAFSAIANEGEMVKPHIVKKIIHQNGKVEEIKTKKIRKVISSESASRTSAMMVSAVKNGYGKKAAVKGYLIAGKTGTAQASYSYFGIQKSGYSSRNIQSFINFAPAFKPEFILLIKMDGPRGGPRFSSDSLAPIAKEINQYLFNYLGIPPKD